MLQFFSKSQQSWACSSFFNLRNLTRLIFTVVKCEWRFYKQISIFEWTSLRQNDRSLQNHVKIWITVGGCYQGREADSSIPHQDSNCSCHSHFQAKNKVQPAVDRKQIAIAFEELKEYGNKNICTVPHTRLLVIHENLVFWLRIQCGASNYPRVDAIYTYNCDFKNSTSTNSVPIGK